MQVYLPDDLYKAVKERRLPASELLQEAVRAELRRQELLGSNGFLNGSPDGRPRSGRSHRKAPRSMRSWWPWPNRAAPFSAGIWATSERSRPTHRTSRSIARDALRRQGLSGLTHPLDLVGEALDPDVVAFHLHGHAPARERDAVDP
jgi:hypothetical protein